MEQLLTITEAADLLRISDKTLRNWRTTGGGPPAIKVGGRLRYRASALNTWLDENTELRTPAPGAVS